MFTSLTEYNPSAKFFDKINPDEDQSFTVSDVKQERYKKLDKIFDNYFEYESISLAKVSKPY